MHEGRFERGTEVRVQRPTQAEIIRGGDGSIPTVVKTFPVEPHHLLFFQYADQGNACVRFSATGSLLSLPIDCLEPVQ